MERLIKAEALVEQIEALPLSGEEELDDELIELYTNISEQLVISDNLSVLAAQLPLLEKLNTNKSTKLVITYIISTFLTEARKCI